MAKPTHTFTLTDSDRKQLHRRVHEHIRRGFRPLKFYNIETERSQMTNCGYKDGFGEYHRQRESTGSTTYCAVMSGRLKETCRSS
ncbi:hypothetical protein [Sporosarcina trichiuri]|uniref:hypothetical protein n=1 Tax=Sporosarcina trichiuri TaxID=3056445 RepID=UPI0025B468C1|nr:hypothetical protein [Sporosarcina sp. 0.2-SM1T-5]WJY27429.1 hypothetical protein QWT68_15530 [Sporosarcina sp. 0.2-SM1T-5]WJY27449.1 hypothetical protein QWT68_00050 [Sporosarcina sp. 0.2-SM1T-5]